MTHRTTFCPKRSEPRVESANAFCVSLRSEDHVLAIHYPIPADEAEVAAAESDDACSVTSSEASSEALSEVSINAAEVVDQWDEFSASYAIEGDTDPECTEDFDQEPL